VCRLWLRINLNLIPNIEYHQLLTVTVPAMFDVLVATLCKIPKVRRLVDHFTGIPLSMTLFSSLLTHSAKPYENVRSTCFSCQRHNFPSFLLIPSLRERYTPGLWFLPHQRQGISKEHQLRVAQDHKPFKKCQFPYPNKVACYDRCA
jgi:hypothetical protein